MEKDFIKGKKNFIIMLISLFFLFVSSEAFSMELDDQEIELATARILSHPNNSENTEASPLTIDSEEQIKHRLAQAIFEKHEEYLKNPSPQFALLEIPPIVGMFAGAPYSQFAMRKAGDSLFLKIWFTGGTIGSVGLSRVWALDALFNEIWSGSKQTVCTHATVNTLSLLSALPLTYAAWRHNPNILYTVIMGVSEWSLSTLGFYEVFKNIRGQNLNINPNVEFPENQELLPLETLTLPVRQLYRHLLSQPNPDSFADDLLMSIEEMGPSNAPTSNTLEYIELAELPMSLPKTITKGIFYVIPVASLIVNSILAYQSIHEFVSSPFVVVPYIALTTIPTFALQLYTTSSSVDDLWGDTINKRAYFKAKSTTSFYLLGGLSMLTSFGSALWGVEVVESAFKGSLLERATPFFLGTTVAQLVIFESHCARDYLAKKYFHYKELNGSEQEKKATTLVNILGEVAEAEENISTDYAWYNPIGWCKKAFSCMQNFFSQKPSVTVTETTSLLPNSSALMTTETRYYSS